MWESACPVWREQWLRQVESASFLRPRSVSGNRILTEIPSPVICVQTDGMYFYESHLKIFEAIKNRNPKEAAYYMAEHFQNKFPNYQYYMDVHAL